MRNTIAKIIPAMLCAAAVTATVAQSASTSSTIQLGVEENGATVKSGRYGPKRIVTSARSPEVRAWAYSGGHPFAAERAGQTVIVQTGEFDAKAAEALREDMAVMSRILQKTCADFAAESERVMGLDIAIHGGRARNLFIEGYGALFMLDVDIPLRATAKPEDKKGEEKSNANEEWESARNELFGPRRALAPKLAVVPVREFRKEDLHRLRNDLIDALRNAANIRGLKDDHQVTVVVRGREGGREGDLYFGEGDAREGDSTMVLKVRKGEIDAFAKGAKGLARDEFLKRILISIY